MPINSTKGEPLVESSPDAIGEVLSANITSVTAQIWTGKTIPSFGSFLTCKTEQSNNIFMVVYNVSQGPSDDNHYPRAFGLTREELAREQPQIFSLLATTIEAQIVGHATDDGRYYHSLPPLPPQIHDFISPAPSEELNAFCSKLTFLRLLTQITKVPQDELLSACIGKLYLHKRQNYDFLLEAGKELGHLFSHDYDRLIAILRKLRPEQL